jgi:hypothetical protein
MGDLVEDFYKDYKEPQLDENGKLKYYLPHAGPPSPSIAKPMRKPCRCLRASWHRISASPW